MKQETACQPGPVHIMPWQHWPDLHESPPGHPAQAAPPLPHCWGDCEPCCTQVCPLQQPPGHEFALHTHWPVVLSHSVPAEHATHAAPPAPQAEVDSMPAARHVPPAVQQPLGHELGLHTHCPLPVSQVWPAAHAAHCVPPAPHEPVVSLASGSHIPPAVQQPLHELPPQVHMPMEHVPPAAHGAHMAPAVPHARPDCDPYATHWPPAVQQPIGHELWSHTGAVSTGASCPCVTSEPPESPPAVASPPSSPGCTPLLLPDEPLLLPLEDALLPWPPSPAGAGP